MAWVFDVVERVISRHGLTKAGEGRRLDVSAFAGAGGIEPLPPPHDQDFTPESIAS
jgi:hypothetical protein